MAIKKLITPLLTHVFTGLLGIAIGIYLLPIITASPSLSAEKIASLSSNAIYTTHFKKDLQDSDFLHWGEGKVSVGTNVITLLGKLAPGPDYRLYLSEEFVETEADFSRLKSTMIEIGDIKTFENFSLNVSPDIDISQYNTVIVWCEAFGQFITSAKYR